MSTLRSPLVVGPPAERLDEAPRGIFPLPKLHVDVAPGKLSRRSSQRLCRRIRLQEDMNEVVSALNWMAGVAVDHGAFSPSALQSETLAHVKAACVASLELPEGHALPITPEAAFRALLCGSSVYAEANSTLTSFCLERISLPDDTHDCPEVEKLLMDTDAYQYLKDPERMLRPPEEVVCDVTPYWDPLLRSSAKHYRRLIQHLDRIGFLAYTLSPRERAGIFFVRKSDGIRQRLIVDGRRANARLATPPSVRLCSPESFAKAEFEVDGGRLADFPGFKSLPELHVGLSDIRDCFHRLKQPRWLQEYFCFDPVPASWVGLQGQMLDGVKLQGSDLVYPMPSSLPMGCSWSLYFAQTLSEKLMGQVGALSESTLLRDRGLPLVIKSLSPGDALSDRQPDGHRQGNRSLPEGDPRHYVYVDNLGVLSTDRTLVETAIHEITETFECEGLKLHPGEIKSHNVEALGCRLSGRDRRASLKPARLWKLRQAIRYLLKLPRVCGRTLEVVLGHATYCALLNRNLMPIFHSTYKFIRKHYQQKVALWPSVRQEFKAFGGLLPLCYSDWSRPWNSYIAASDASLSGYGVCGRKVDPEIAGRIGRVPERERFRRGAVGSARASALSAAADEDGGICDHNLEAILQKWMGGQL